ncbi:MAG: thiamine pyrophosphate-dependent enzyme [Acidobacteriota bacterium]
MTNFTREEVVRDYRMAATSREASLLGRREVLTGKAKFGIFGDGKELPQLAMAKAFQPGDFRSGYYRDQTFMLAAGMVTLEQLFAQLYADWDGEREAASSGRQMNSHFATPTLDREGRWHRLVDQKNSSADTSPTGSQMPRLVGLAQASKFYRELPGLEGFDGFSTNGDEVAFGTIGNASCAEGMFWESINAIGVLGVPAVVSIWDDGYGISVPNEYQITKSDLSALLSGFERTPENPSGYQVFTVRGWDYPSLVAAYQQAAEVARREHVPAIIHVIELTQPQGHSTSGSHERYKSAERLRWEAEHDGLFKMRSMILERGWATEDELLAIEAEAKDAVRAAQRSAWSHFMDPIRAQVEEMVELLQTAASADGVGDGAATEVAALVTQLQRIQAPWRRHLMTAGRDAVLALHAAPDAARRPLLQWLEALDQQCAEKYGRYLHAEGERAAAAIEGIGAVYSDDAPELNGFEILNHCFDAALERHPELVAFGEDLGQLGDVNQGFRGLQEKYGKLRVADVGIRECTILGQAIGLAMRGMRPLAEIQYLDYLHYALQIISDDLATVRWRTAGRQQAPVIIRTRGHRFEGVWHAGSPMAGILGLIRGVFLCVPRDMTQAAGMYNTLLRSDDSAIVIEVLNGYRRKERLPSNLAEFSVPLGVPEVLREGDDCTLVTYGACCRVALDAAAKLARIGVEVEVIDVQTLLPFDTDHRIVSSVKKTGRLLLLDEDVPGGATAFMQQKIVEDQGAFHWLDAPPRSVTAAEHRPAYASDGDYWSKPNAERIFDAIYAMMHEADRRRFPLFTSAVTAS